MPLSNQTPRGAKNRKKSQKKEQMPGGALIYLYILKRPGAFFFALFREEGPVGRAHDTRRCAKKTCCQSRKERFAACSGRNSTGIFFFSSYLFINSSFFFFTFVSQPVGSTPNQYFFSFSGNAPGRAFCPTFVLKNAPGTLQTPRGRHFGITLWNAPGGVYSILYGTHLMRQRILVLLNCRISHPITCSSVYLKECLQEEMDARVTVSFLFKPLLRILYQGANKCTKIQRLRIGMEKSFLRVYLSVSSEISHRGQILHSYCV